VVLFNQVSAAIELLMLQCFGGIDISKDFVTFRNRPLLFFNWVARRWMFYAFCFPGLGLFAV